MVIKRGPYAFSLLMPSLYLPILVMVIALLLRGITFEFRLKEKKNRWIWNYIFFLSSVIVTISQGLLLGSFVEGFKINPDQQLVFSILKPFNITCAIALLFGYSLLGSTWIILKTTGPIQEKMYKVAFCCLIIVSFFLGIISLWTPFVAEVIWQRWFGDNFYHLLFLPIITTLLIALLLRCIMLRREYWLYALTVGIFFCSYLGFGISTWPYLIPHQVTIWKAAAPLESQLFMLIGTLLLLPILIAYTSYAYYIFRDKVTDVIEY
jgi:cytochrome d ubiquinol oxidase subunit II